MVGARHRLAAPNPTSQQSPLRKQGVFLRAHHTNPILDMDVRHRSHGRARCPAQDVRAPGASTESQACLTKRLSARAEGSYTTAFTEPTTEVVRSFDRRTSRRGVVPCDARADVPRRAMCLLRGRPTCVGARTDGRDRNASNRGATRRSGPAWQPAGRGTSPRSARSVSRPQSPPRSTTP